MQKIELIKVLLAIGFECIVGMKACYPPENSQNRPIVLKTTLKNIETLIDKNKVI